MIVVFRTTSQILRVVKQMFELIDSSTVWRLWDIDSTIVVPLHPNAEIAMQHRFLDQSCQNPRKRMTSRGTSDVRFFIRFRQFISVTSFRGISCLHLVSNCRQWKQNTRLLCEWMFTIHASGLKELLNPNLRRSRILVAFLWISLCKTACPWT